MGRWYARMGKALVSAGFDLAIELSLKQKMKLYKINSNSLMLF